MAAVSGSHCKKNVWMGDTLAIFEKSICHATWPRANTFRAQRDRAFQRATVNSQEQHSSAMGYLLTLWRGDATVRDQRLSSEWKSFTAAGKPAQSRVRALGMRFREEEVGKVCFWPRAAEMLSMADPLAIPGLVREVSAGLAEGGPTRAPTWLKGAQGHQLSM